jgi:hypothetical protein
MSKSIHLFTANFLSFPVGEISSTKGPKKILYCIPVAEEIGTGATSKFLFQYGKQPVRNLTNYLGNIMPALKKEHFFEELKENGFIAVSPRIIQRDEELSCVTDHYFLRDTHDPVLMYPIGLRIQKNQILIAEDIDV